jgi:broad specificity phosphatase PhoE
MPTLQRTITLIRHGETAWSLAKKHTGWSDISLTENGKKQAARLSQRLKSLHFDAVYASPLKRALETAHLAGFSPTIDPDLKEWSYGTYEGVTRDEILKTNPHWDLFTQGAPQGETPQAVQKRAEQFLSQISSKNVAIFAHAHILRVLAMCWLHLPLKTARHFVLSTASVSTLGWEHTSPAIICWNDIHHLM